MSNEKVRVVVEVEIDVNRVAECFLERNAGKTMTPEERVSSIADYTRGYVHGVINGVFDNPNNSTGITAVVDAVQTKLEK